MKHRKVKGEQVITLKWLSNYVVPGQLFYRQCKVKLLFKTDSLY